MEPLSQEASERLAAYERELRSHLGGLAPVERDEAVRELKAHVLAVVEGGRTMGNSDDAAVMQALGGFGTPHEYAQEYMSSMGGNSPELGFIDRAILITVKAAAKVWVALLLGLVYLVAFSFLFIASFGAILASALVIADSAGILPQVVKGANFRSDATEFGAILVGIFGIAAAYLTVRLLIKVIRFHYYYRSSPRKLIAYLRQRKAGRRVTLWRVADVSAAIVLVAAFMAFFLLQPLTIKADEGRKIAPVTVHKRLQPMPVTTVDATLKLVGDVALAAEPSSGLYDDLAQFSSTYTFDVLKPVLEVRRRGNVARVIYVPNGSNGHENGNITFSGSFPYSENLLDGNKHEVRLSPTTVWNLNIDCLRGNSDINLAGIRMDRFDLKLFSDGSRDSKGVQKVAFASTARKSGNASFKRASLTCMSGTLDADFSGVRNGAATSMDIRVHGLSTTLRSVGDANPQRLKVSAFADETVMYLNGAWSTGTKRIDMTVHGDNLLIYVPRGIPVRVEAQNFGGETRIFNAVSKGSITYEMPGFDASPLKVDMRIKAPSCFIEIRELKR